MCKWNLTKYVWYLIRTNWNYLKKKKYMSLNCNTHSRANFTFLLNCPFDNPPTFAQLPIMCFQNWVYKGSSHDIRNKNQGNIHVEIWRKLLIQYIFTIEYHDYLNKISPKISNLQYWQDQYLNLTKTILSISERPVG